MPSVTSLPIQTPITRTNSACDSSGGLPVKKQVAFEENPVLSSPPAFFDPTKSKPQKSGLKRHDTEPPPILPGNPDSHLKQFLTAPSFASEPRPRKSTPGENHMRQYCMDALFGTSLLNEKINDLGEKQASRLLPQMKPSEFAQRTGKEVRDGQPSRFSNKEDSEGEKAQE